MSVPGYTILEEIRHGTDTATLYRAREQASGRVVCLEVFRRSFDHPPGSRDDYHAHVLAVVRLLDHPNIWPAWRLGEAASGLYFVRPWPGGGFLQEYLPDERPGPARAADWVRQLALAVQHAHDHGVYHGDLHPSCVLLAPDPGGAPRPLLFGFEKARVAFLPPALRHLEQSPEGAICGTPAYMSPELLTGQRSALTPAADVWGLGVILYVLLTGRLPFRGETVMETVMGVLQRDPPAPRAADASLDADLERITLRCLRKRPEDRYATAADLADALGRWQGGERTPRSFTQRLRSWIGGR